MIEFIGNVLDTLIPTSAREWHEWLSREEEKTFAKYHIKPTDLIADFHRERDIARDYVGREILEMLQNANDQAAELDQRGRVLIELTYDGLIVANTGLAFSVGGVASIQTSHLSPKRSRRSQLIGNKGLGFRSVLNWTRTPIILSGSLSIAYCLEDAKRKLKALIDLSSEIAQRVRDEQQGGDALILPLLPFPLFSINGDLAQYLADDKAKRIFERCEAILVDGYDTVIGMPFDTADGYDAARTQIDELRPEILLFAQHLGELCFHRDQSDSLIWRREGSDETAEVLANGELIGKWQVFRTDGKLPEAFIELDKSTAVDYEIVVAIPIEGPRNPAPLFSHFPTDIVIPLPIVCHATLELEQNRKHLQQGRKSNEFVLSHLAEFLSEIAEKIAAVSAHDLWAGCSLLMPLGDFPIDLKRVCFFEKMMKAAQARAIVPTLRGITVRPDSARLVPGADTSWLPSALFPEIVPIRHPEELHFLKSLGVAFLAPIILKQEILKHPELTVDERCALIDGLMRNQIAAEAFTSALFIDSVGKGLEDSMRVFIAPGDSDVPKLPGWLDLRFLNDAMRLKITEVLGIRDNRVLQQRLSGFGLIEYSLAGVISGLVAAANRAIRKEPERAEIFENDLLHTVFRLYCAEGNESKRPEYPEKRQLQLRNQRSESAMAETLHLGRGFGTQGEIIQALYESWAPEKLISEPEILSLTDDKDLVKGFLMWIGVAEWPRETTTENPDPGYLKDLLSKITFPARFQDYLFDSRDKVERPSAKRVKSIDGIDSILQNAAPHAIAAWLSLDGRVPGWQRRAKEHAELCSRPGQTWTDRVFQGELPSYIRWILETRSWLVLPGGEHVSPKDCVLGERIAESLFPRPAMPDETELSRYGIHQPDLVEGWRRAGVLTSLAYLERDDIYAKLLELPQRCTDGKLARPLYHWLLDASELALGGEGENRKEFLAHGRMWGRHGKDEGYFPITELHHADVEGLPDMLLQRLKIVDLRKRVGAEKVERLFGVKPIDRSGIERRQVAKEIAMGSTIANNGFQDAKPYLHKLRASQTSQLLQLQVLKDLKLEVCSMLRAEINFENDLIEYDVPVWGWLIENKTLYIRSDPAKPMELSDSLLSDAISEALASVFRIADGGDFARMLTCKEEDRLVLLGRLLGESELEDIETIKSEYALFKPRIEIEAKFPVTEPPKVPQISQQEKDSSVNETLPSKALLVPSGPLQIIEGEHIQVTTAEPRKLQIKTVTSSGSRSETQHRVTDGDFCERKALEVEEASDPARWPLPVGQIMGAEGPGCDVLSFASQEAREAFRQGTTRDLTTVVRFIEVKGRGNAGATIELKGNELSAAELYRERYFLYRLYQMEDGSFELDVLQNPLIHKEALQPAVHVVMQRAASMQRFKLIDGLKNNSGV